MRHLAAHRRSDELKELPGMARMAAAGFWSRVRSCAPAIRHDLFGAAFVLAALMSQGAALAAEPVQAEATFSSGGGFARLVIKFGEDVGSEVVTAGSIIVIRFERPVDVSVDKVAESVPDYVGAARRDPDGSAIRLSLSRKVTINTMTAGERLFVDLLPESWKGPPPNLPNEVVRELADRARAAERELRQQRAISEAKKRPPVRVRASVQPTFVRFVFEMPDGVGVSSVLNEQKLKLLFSKALTFDLADAKLSAPPNVSSISQKIESETAVVELTMLGDVDVHSFREDKNYVIDVAFQPVEKSAAMSQASDASHTPPTRAAERRAALMLAAPVPAAPVLPPAMTAETQVAVTPVPAVPATTMPAVAEKPAAPALPPRAAELPVAPMVSEASAEAAPKMPAVSMPAASEVSIASHAPAETPAAVATEVAPKQSMPAASSEVRPEAGVGDVSVIRDGEGLHLTFAVPTGTPAALFRRADTLWLMLDSKKPINVEPIRGQGGSAVADVSVVPQDRG
jgi:hypothetical protein